MSKGINVEVRTGLFARVKYKLKAAADGLTFTPAAKGGDKISIPAASIREITFYEARLQMEVQTNILTDAFFANADDLHDVMNTLKDNTELKIVCEFN